MSKSATEMHKFDWTAPDTLKFNVPDPKAEVEGATIEVTGAAAVANYFYFAIYRHIEVNGRAMIATVARLTALLKGVTVENPKFEVTQAEYEQMVAEYERALAEGSGRQTHIKFTGLDLDHLAEVERIFQEAK